MPIREPMTTKGYQALQVEIKDLKTVQRPQISEEIETARAHGDLKENAEYHAAKEKQSFVEGRIKEVESRLSLAEVIDHTSLSGDKVLFGATVTVEDIDGKSSTYQIVGRDEADLKMHKVSMSAPIARALIGKSVGDIAQVRLPKTGLKELEIISVSFV